MSDNFLSLISSYLITPLFNLSLKAGLTVIIIIAVCWWIAGMHIFYRRDKPVRNIRWWIIQLKVIVSLLWAITVFIGSEAVANNNILLGFVTVALVVVNVLFHMYMTDKRKELSRRYY